MSRKPRNSWWDSLKNEYYHWAGREDESCFLRNGQRACLLRAGYCPYGMIVTRLHLCKWFVVYAAAPEGSLELPDPRILSVPAGWLSEKDPCSQSPIKEKHPKANQGSALTKRFGHKQGTRVASGQWDVGIFPKPRKQVRELLGEQTMVPTALAKKLQESKVAIKALQPPLLTLSVLFLN